ncbi:hypothetical protein Tco_0132175 [Tanacetum coccineum]
MDSLDQLENNLEQIPPYNSNLPPLDDIRAMTHRVIFEKETKEGIVHKLTNLIETNELLDHLKPCELVIRENALVLHSIPAVPAVLSPVPVEWSPVPVVNASMSKSAQPAPVGYVQMSVMLQSLPASCGLPVASLKSQSDSYGQLPASEITVF